MKAVWNGNVIAEADKEALIYIEGNWYFPPESVQAGILEPTETSYTCPWKGKCQYFTVSVDGEKNVDAAWSYPEPLPSAIERVHKDFSGYVAFWRGVAMQD